MYAGLQVKYRIFLSSFNRIWNCSAYFCKRSPILNFTAFRPVRDALIQAECRKEGHNAINRRLWRLCEHAQKMAYLPPI